MANVKTFNLSVYLPGNKGTITFRGISRVAVARYKKYYITEYLDGAGSRPYFNVEAR